LEKEQHVKLFETLGRKSNALDMINMDNIADELQNLIRLCGDDPARDGLQETPYRVIKAFFEYTQGYRQDPKALLDKVFQATHDEIVVVRDIEFNSMCEHHFAPFFGKAHIAYIPTGNIVGLSKFARMVDAWAKRFQVQERLTAQIADTIDAVLSPAATAVIVEATHYCMCGRGVEKRTSTTVTSAMRGAFRTNDAARSELMQLINLGR